VAVLVLAVGCVLAAAVVVGLVALIRRMKQAASEVTREERERARRRLRDWD
jgi:uncharacterized iron-regulated membrane protein